MNKEETRRVVYEWVETSQTLESLVTMRGVRSVNVLVQAVRLLKHLLMHFARVILVHRDANELK